jgi:peptidoglycan hydrolase CwlO-like protein
LEREEREDEEIKGFNKLTEQDNARIKIIKARLGNLKKGNAEEDEEFEDLEALEGELRELESNIAKRKKIIDGYMEKRYLPY